MRLYRVVTQSIGLMAIIIGLLGTTVMPLRSTVSRAEPATHANHQPAQATNALDESIFGIETLSARIVDTEVIDRASTLGASWIRLNTLSWRSIQEHPESEYTWSGEEVGIFRNELLSAAEANLIPMAIVDDYPYWATGQENSCAAIQPDYFDKYARFMQAVVQRYKDPPYNVKYWELGNEVDIDPSLVAPNNPFGCWGDKDDPYYGGEQYGEMLKVVVPAIKQVDPEAQVMIGGLLLDRPETNIPGRGNPEKFFEGILRSGAGESFDIVAFHAYPWYGGRNVDGDLADSRWDQLGGATLGKAKFLRDVMERYDVDKPLFLNEGSLLTYQSSHGEQFYQTQGDHIVRVGVRALFTDIQAFCWYTLHESDWYAGGLLNEDLSPRPNFTAYQHLIEQTRGLDRPTATSTYGNDIEAYRFLKDDHVVDVLWTREPETRTVEMSSNLFIAAYTRDGDTIEPTEQGDTITIDVGFTPMYIWRLPSPIIRDPLITSVTPSDGYTDEATPLVITGRNFVADSQVMLQGGSDEQTITLAPVTFVDTTRLEVEVPAVLSAGRYDLIVTNPGDKQGILENAFNVLDPSANPDIQELRPDYGRADLPNHINIYGTNLINQEGFSVAISDTILAVDYISGTHVRASIPANVLPSGVYSVTVTNPGGNSATLPSAYTIYSDNDEDFAAYDYEFWTEPIIPRSNQEAQVGIIIHRRGGTQSSQEFLVSFYPDDPQRGVASFGDATVSLRSGRTLLSNSSVVWEAPATGTIYAELDSTSAISETSESNNLVSREITVLPAAEDQIAPTIESFTLNGGSTTTTARNISFVIEATDPQPTTQVAWVFVMEYEYSQGTEQWWPVHPLHPTENDWKPIEQFTTWNLANIPGKRYLQVWVADKAGNVSAPASQSIIYGPESTGIANLPPADLMPSEKLALPMLPRISNEVQRFFYMPLVSR